jgi:hypothetical protein
MPVITPDQMRYWTDGQRDRAMNWCRANRIDPDDVSATRAIEIGEGAIAYHRYVRNEQGKIQRHPTQANEVWTEPEIARYLVELPDGL